MQGTSNQGHSLRVREAGGDSLLRTGWPQAVVEGGLVMWWGGGCPEERLGAVGARVGRGHLTMKDQTHPCTQDHGQGNEPARL